MNNPTRTVISRRSRPAKEPLSRELIVRTALALLEKEGSSGMTMRRIAKELDTGPSSLYVYVSNVQELSSYVLDAGLEKIAFKPGKAGEWKEKLLEILFSYQQVLLDFPGLAELALTAIPVGTNSLELSESILSCLYEAGVETKSAAWGVDLLLLYVSSLSFERTTRDKQESSLEVVSETYRAVDAIRYPMLARSRTEMTSGEMTEKGHERFLWGLEVILQGIVKNQS